MTDAKIEVLPVPEGSIIWCHNTFLEGDDEGGNANVLNELSEGIARAVGHSSFVLVCTNGEGNVEVLGEGAFVDRLRAVVAENWPDQV